MSQTIRGHHAKSSNTLSRLAVSPGHAMQVTNRPLLPRRLSNTVSLKLYEKQDGGNSPERPMLSVRWEIVKACNLATHMPQVKK